jgi:hypothetical protein
MDSSQFRAELDVLTRELDEAQRMIDHGRKTYFGKFPIIRSMLNSRQLIVDSQRIRVEAAKKNLDVIK